MSTGSADLLADAQRLLPDLIELRRRIHRTPELGLQLPKTQATVDRKGVESGKSGDPGGSRIF